MDCDTDGLNRGKVVQHGVRDRPRSRLDQPERHAVKARDATSMIVALGHCVDELVGARGIKQVHS
jgi:hypothetical protein